VLPLVGPNEQLTAIEETLNRKGPGLRFPPRLEAAYETARGAARNRAVGTFLLVYLAAKLLFLLANLEIGSKVFYLSMELRLGIVLPLTLTAFFLLRRPLTSRVPPWIYGFLAFAPLVAETALVMLLGRLSGTRYSERYVLAAAVGIFAQTLLMRAPFRYCATGLAVSLTVFCVFSRISWPGHFGSPISIDEVVFAIGFSIPALYERHSRESADRRNFLLGEINRLRMEDILRINEHLQRLSSIDALTGIFNRRYLDSALARSCEVANDKDRWIGILMIDIDYFKKLNDSAGHQHGDYCLERVAQIVQRSVRAGVDTVARYGGEEFCAILPDADGHVTLTIGERIRQSVEEAGFPSTDGRVVTVSAGAIAVRGGDTPRFQAEELVALADQALYQAKRCGRNRVVSWARTLQIPILET
jgi:diguanylate cyclase (GGDEF)-like protein